jgi:hypothetical protein
MFAHRDGVALFSYSIRQFRMAGTPVPGNKPTTAIVRTGPIASPGIQSTWRSSRYTFGLAILVNSLWLVATLIPTVAIIAVVVVPREERYLTGRFGGRLPEIQGLRASLAMTFAADAAPLASAPERQTGNSK